MSLKSPVVTAVIAVLVCSTVYFAAFLAAGALHAGGSLPVQEVERMADLDLPEGISSSAVDVANLRADGPSHIAANPDGTIDLDVRYQWLTRGRYSDRPYRLVVLISPPCPSCGEQADADVMPLSWWVGPPIGSASDEHVNDYARLRLQIPDPGSYSVVVRLQRKDDRPDGIPDLPGTEDGPWRDLSMTTYPSVIVR